MEQLYWYALLGILILVISLLAFRIAKLRRDLKIEIREKQQILSVVSHDIKSPFSRISALEQLIALEGDTLNESQKSYLEKIHQVVADGLSLIRNLVDYRNLEYRKVDVVPECIDLSALVTNVTRSFNSLARTKKQELATKIPSGVTIQSDIRLITRIIENILSNAIKFSPDETTITISMSSGTSLITIEVVDKGPGMDADDLRKLFNKFVKLSPKPTSGESSTGLGLYISRLMANKLGGKIEVDSKLGRGSTFRLVLPS